MLLKVLQYKAFSFLLCALSLNLPYVYKFLLILSKEKLRF